ncbi:Dihydropyrimidinase [Hexamita inflata]|uniref:dihydropyrimidinase n=1 Tax=Hexamita inflata TaxID=28002 RepID=A0AA86NAI5_9EUKA|nr:Dihydropyrimidinase [Hexamita inflata]
MITNQSFHDYTFNGTLQLKGIIQVRFIATYSTLKSANCSLEQISKQTSENVAERFQLPLKGRIQVGFDADLVVVNPYLDTIFSENVRKERMDCSLFNDMTFSGKIEKVFVRGKEFGVDQLEEGSYLRKLLLVNLIHSFNFGQQKTIKCTWLNNYKHCYQFHIKKFLNCCLFKMKFNPQLEYQKVLYIVIKHQVKLFAIVQQYCNSHEF